MKRELKILAALVSIFLVAYFLPLGNPKIQQAIQEAFRLLQWYARNHTLACIVPALFFAGGIITFLSQESVMRVSGMLVQCSADVRGDISTRRWSRTCDGISVFGACDKCIGDISDCPRAGF
jgi:hypothetical protein